MPPKLGNPYLNLLTKPASNPAPQNSQNSTTSNGVNNLLGLFNLVRKSQNPMETLRGMAQSNPQIAQAFSVIDQYGGDVNKAVNEKAKEAGVNPNFIANLFQRG